MNSIFKFIINTVIIVSGFSISYWAIIKWDGTNFAFSSPFRTHDGNAFFYILLIGLAIIGYGIFEYIDWFQNLKDNKRS